MPRGDKSAYTDKQKRKAEHIAEGLQGAGRRNQGSQVPRLGHGQQGKRRRQQVGLGPRQAGYQGVLAQGRPHRRQSLTLRPGMTERLRCTALGFDPERCAMNQIIYLIGLIVVVLAVLAFFGLR